MASLVMNQKVTTTLSQQQQQQQQQSNNNNNNNNQEPLKCPRCGSSNTKFCYYNNYSLSQPRHFCKACKRYWTRGGTLRTVPVGGGCRKNKRLKIRPINNSNNNISPSNNNNTNIITTNSNNNIFHESSINSHNIHELMYSSASNPLFYGMPSTHHSLMNFPFERYYDIQNPQISGLGVGLGFSAGLVSSNPLLCATSTTTTTTTTTATTSPRTTISSLLGGGASNFQTLLPSYEGSLQMKGGVFMKEVKVENEGQNRAIGSHHWSAPTQNDVMDPSVNIWGSESNLGTWQLDPSNNNNNILGSSFPSLS